jgi:hypothetical protein
MKCEHCPVCGDASCDGENVARFCELVDPDGPAFQVKYVKFLQDRANSPAPPAKPALPGLARQMANFSKALVKHAADRFGKVDADVKAERLAACEGCELRVGDRCSHPACGCVLEVKAGWASESCPEGKWSAVAAKGDVKPCTGCGAK